MWRVQGQVFYLQGYLEAFWSLQLSHSLVSCLGPRKSCQHPTGNAALHAPCCWNKHGWIPEHPMEPREGTPLGRETAFILVLYKSSKVQLRVPRGSAMMRELHFLEKLLVLMREMAEGRGAIAPDCKVQPDFPTNFPTNLGGFSTTH